MTQSQFQDKTSKTEPALLARDAALFPEPAQKPEVVGSQAGRGPLVNVW